MKSINIHLWIFNHNKFFGICDQVRYLFSFLKNQRFSLSIGKSPNPNSINVLIENFNDESISTVVDFCEKYDKKIIIILTEHLDILEDDSIRLHGFDLSENSNYIPLNELMRRSNYLLSLVPYTLSYVRLGDLPRLLNFDVFAKEIPLVDLPYPIINESAEIYSEPIYDFIFFGQMTDYRYLLLDKLKKLGFKVAPHITGVSSKVRNQSYKTSKFSLNIPQSERWVWESPMRVFGSLISGRKTINLGNLEGCIISDCTKNILDIDKESNDIFEMLDNYTYYNKEALKKYNRIALSFNEQAQNTCELLRKIL